MVCAVRYEKCLISGNYSEWWSKAGSSRVRWYGEVSSKGVTVMVASLGRNGTFRRCGLEGGSWSLAMCLWGGCGALTLSGLALTSGAPWGEPLPLHALLPWCKASSRALTGKLAMDWSLWNHEPRQSFPSYLSVRNLGQAVSLAKLKTDHFPSRPQNFQDCPLCRHRSGWGFSWEKPCEELQKGASVLDLWAIFKKQAWLSFFLSKLWYFEVNF